MDIISCLSSGILASCFCAAGGWTTSMSTRTPAMWPMSAATITMGSTMPVPSTPMSTIRRPTPTRTLSRGWSRLNSVLDSWGLTRRSLTAIYIESGLLPIHTFITHACNWQDAVVNFMYRLERLRFQSLRFLAELTAKRCPPRSGLVG